LTSKEDLLLIWYGIIYNGDYNGILLN
jgi:hypothetical protein